LGRSRFKAGLGLFHRCPTPRLFFFWNKKLFLFFFLGQWCKLGVREVADAA
jgi:hypothetical protein